MLLFVSNQAKFMSKLPPEKYFSNFLVKVTHDLQFIQPRKEAKSHQMTYMFHVEDVLIPDSEEDQHGQDGAADEGDGLGDDCGHGRHEDVHVVGRGSVGSRQSRQQLVFKLIKMSTKGNCDYQ